MQNAESYFYVFQACTRALDSAGRGIELSDCAENERIGVEK